ncbi:MAG TPA: iron-containing redox enzyme family protein [Fimbriimonadaceae bacterium]|nr:iron-containing redox enzyme family protein [Fimbriimonadaceae bacterium]
MNRVEQLDAIVKQFELNGHPFYAEWKAGTLPAWMLADYAGQYGHFVGTIADGWETLGENFYADEEREHEVLWTDFKTALGTRESGMAPSTQTLVTAAKNLFATKPEAIGALYAFEAQQPYTSRAKLDGLNEHYSVSEEGKEYFRVHADDIAEVELLKKHIESLTDEEFARAKTACALVCTAMYGALDGIYVSRQVATA